MCIFMFTIIMRESSCSIISKSFTIIIVEPIDTRERTQITFSLFMPLPCTVKLYAKKNN